MTRLSVVYQLKRTGPRTDPCGTPNGIYLGHGREPNMLILWYRFDKYEPNHRSAMPEIPKYLCKRSKIMSLVVMTNCIKYSRNIQQGKRGQLSIIHVVYYTII